MGIKSLLKLNEQLGLIKKSNKLNYKYKRVAIDISILIYKIIISVRNSGADYTNTKGEITSHILGLFNKTIDLLKNKIIPVYVFDGKPPKIKEKTLEDRKLVRQKALDKLEKADNEKDKIKYFKRCVSISKKQWDDCRDLLKLMGIPYIDAPEEADSQCAYLAKNNYVDAVLTEDMDILTFGSPKIVRNLTSYKNEITEINLEDILKKLELSHDQFIEYCILLGSDYSAGVQELKPLDILRYYQKDKNILETLKKMKSDNIKVPSFPNLQEIKNYFQNPKIEKEFDLELKKPDVEVLLVKLVNDYGLIKYLIKNKLSMLNKYYDNLHTSFSITNNTTN
jgi:flap endonuclease-1